MPFAFWGMRVWGVWGVCSRAFGGWGCACLLGDLQVSRANGLRALLVLKFPGCCYCLRAGCWGWGVFRACIGVPFSLFKFCPHSFADGGSRNSKINMQRANHLLLMMCYSINKVWLNLLACGDNLILLLLYSSFGYKRMLSKHVSITTSFRTTFLDITNYILQNGSQDKNLW